ncbi:MAG: hypothetical protein LAT82_04145 [Nanoarchaeota archaeon]|nr:hypothetical protein [Nanoarchaeota archaeon]
MNKKTYNALGMSSMKEYLMSYFLTILMLDIVVLLIFIFAFYNVMIQGLGFALFFIIILMLLVYPSIIIDSQARNIDENLHYFITYAGALSTINLGRKELFYDFSQKGRYREIANIFSKIYYLVQSIKVDFSTASYKVANTLNTEHFARFLERMGISLSFNASLQKFFIDEQKAMMNSYEIVYKESLERIKLIQEMYVSLMLSFAFLLSTVLLLPFLTGLDPNYMMQFGLLGIVLVNVIMMVFIKFFLPTDRLFHSLGYEEGRKNMIKWFIISITGCLILTPIVWNMDIPIMLKIAVVGSPLMLCGWYGRKVEREITNRDTLFPSFIRSFGDIHQSKGGTLTTTIETLLPHNFGILDGMLNRVYKRLKITSDKFNSWYYFSKESGSALIAEFTDIFISVVYRGGSADIAGEIVSDNMDRINGLRDQKKEVVSTMRGNVYGSFIGIALTIYISLLVSVVLFDIFGSVTTDIDALELDVIEDIFPSDLDISFQVLSFYVAIILVIQAFFSAYIVKEIDGGHPISGLMDVSIMLWVGALFDIGLTYLFMNMFSSFFIA